MGQARDRRNQGRAVSPLTLLLSETEVASMLEMKEVVRSVEEAFMRQSASEAVNYPRTRTSTPHSVLNVMHASLAYLGRAGVKCYLGSRKGTRFVFLLFDAASGEPLSVMGADMLGRYRTGAASAVATKHLLRAERVRLGICGSGKQAYTQVAAMNAALTLQSVRVWSPDRQHREGFASKLSSEGFDVTAVSSAFEALADANVGATITSSRVPFLGDAAVANLSHLSLCGANYPDRAEADPSAISRFGTVVVDDLAQARVEAGDLIQAEKAGSFKWERAVELKDVVSGRVIPSGKTLFKSGGVALEDVAVASLVYDRAVKSGLGREVELGFGPV